MTEPSPVSTDLGVSGYWLACADGRVISLGSFLEVGAVPDPRAPIVDIIAAPGGMGCWVASADGRVAALGGAPDPGPPAEVTAPVVGLAAPREGPGCWLACADGTIVAVGGAVPVDVARSITPSAPAVGLAIAPAGFGGWLATADGQLREFGDAPPLDDVTLHAEVVGVAARADRHGCWLVGRDGSIAVAGDAPFFGASPFAGMAGPEDAVGIAIAPDGLGYLIAGERGAVIPCGIAAFHGPHAGLPADVEIVAIATASPAVRADHAPLLEYVLNSNVFRDDGRAARLAAADALSFPRFATPVVSIIIPVHGQCGLTVRCLASIAADATEVPYEVIVVDDGSPDDSREVLSRVTGLHLLENAVNEGFGNACNMAARLATSEYLVMLNNDTEVHEGWLDELVGTAAADPSIGLVGAKLVFPDGTLQEAGGIVWRDASASNYGRSRPADSRDCTFVRDVDYCSAACLLARREVFELVGGFDPRYAPAYYEDVDLAFATRAAGYRVVYQPRAVVTHLEGQSHGTDMESGLKRYQVVHRETFREKWAAALREQRPRNLVAARLASRRAPRRAAYFDVCVPRFDRDAGSQRAYELMLGLIDLGFAITLVPEDPTLYEPYAEALERAGIEIVDPVRETNVGAFLEEVGAGLDLVVLSRPETAARRLIPLRRAAPHAKVVFDTVDLASLRERRRAGVDISAADAGVAEATRALELALFGAADAVVAVTDVEREAITHEVPGARVFVWPTIHEVVSSVPPPSGRSGLLFVGNFLHLPNVDGVQWFLESVLPELRARGIRDVVQVVGELPSEELRSYERRDVRILGWVRDLDPLYASARVFVAPLRFGAGIKGKVAESLGRGLPVVTTSVGAEGFRAGAAHGLLVADDVGGFADAVAQLVQDDAVWSIASAGGLAEVEARFSRSAVAASLASSLRELGILTPPVSVDAGP